MEARRSGRRMAAAQGLPSKPSASPRGRHGPPGFSARRDRRDAMIPRNVLRRVHLVAGVAAFLTILTFWAATVLSELFGDKATVAAVKNGVLWGLLVLVPAMAAVGGSGFRLGGR